MARIRTVKPEFWTDEKVVECSIPARLLFIGLFNFANDKGCLERSPKRIKMQVFPADILDCEPLLVELITHGLLTEYSVNGLDYLSIRGFVKHQKINRPSASNIPNPPEFTECEHVSGGEFTEDSLKAHGGLTEESLSANGELTDGRDTDTEGNKHKTTLLGEHEKNSFSDEAKSKDPSVPPELPVYFPDLDDPVGLFSMYPDWKPSPDFRKRAAVWGIFLPEQDFLPTELAEFIAWYQPGRKAFHQVQWEQKFARHIQHVRATAPKTQISGDSHGIQPAAASRAVQEIRAARAQWEQEHASDAGVDIVGKNGRNFF